MPLYPPSPILMVDDEPQALQSFSTALRSMGMSNVLTEDDPTRVPDLLAKQPVEAVLLDLVMPGLGGEELLEHIAVEHPGVPVVMVTGIDDLETAVRLMRKGASDYVLKPVRREDLGAALRRVLELARLERMNARLARRVLSDELEHPEAFEEILTQDARMRGVFQYCEAVAPGLEPVFITGETGTGKELLARAVHRLSGRPGEFVAVNAAGLDEHAFTDTLFGHLKGAFTGADAPRRGFIDRAARGTLFLDEIGDLDQSSQIRLLRVLQEREYHPLGSDAARPMQARVVAATHRDPGELLASGRFRKDFYYRLRTHHVHLPPLRERRGDVPLLLDHFLARAARDLDRPVPSYPPQLPVLISAHGFEGNVRELRSLVYDALSAHAGGMLSMRPFRQRLEEDGASAAAAGAASGEGDRDATLFASFDRLPTLAQATADLIEEALRRSEGNLRMASGWLGISHQALSKRLKRSGD